MSQVPPAPAKGGFVPPSPEKGYRGRGSDPITGRPVFVPPPVAKGSAPPVKGGVTAGAETDGFVHTGRPGSRYKTKPCDDGEGQGRLIGGPYNRHGINHHGYDCDGYRSGLDPWGFNAAGFSQEGYDPWGYDHRGYDKHSRQVLEKPKLLHYRGQYLGDPLGFRERFEIGPTGEISEPHTHRRLWSDDE